MENDFDFGFTFADDELGTPQQTTPTTTPEDTEFKSELLDKITALESKLEEHYNNAPLWDSSMDPVYSALPALIAELRQLRALTTPEARP